MKWDFFGEPVKLNFAGNETIRTFLGTLVSLILFVLLSLYAMQMFGILYYRKNPDIVEAKIPDFFPNSQKFSFEELNFPLAFGILSFPDLIPKNDPDYVEWSVTLNVVSNEDYKYYDLKIHACTDEDYEEFMTPSE